MSPLMKSLCQFHELGPMSPPPLSCAYRKRMDDESNISAAVSPHPQTPRTHTLPSPRAEPHLPPIREATHTSTRRDAICNNQPSQLDATIDSPLPAQVQNANYELALDGVSLEVLMLGAAMSAVPGLQTASAVYTTVASGAERLSRTVQRATHLSRAFRRGGCTEENISSDWVEVSPQDVHNVK